MDENHKLSFILFAGIAGYTTLMLASTEDSCFLLNLFCVIKE